MWQLFFVWTALSALSFSCCQIVDPKGKLCNNKNVFKILLYGWLTIPVKSIVQGTLEWLREDVAPRLTSRRILFLTGVSNATEKR